MTLTKQQGEALNYLADEILEHDGLGPRHMDDYEYKSFEIRIDEVEWRKAPMVFLRTEVGRKGDEGTMGELLGRTRRHIMVGPRGRMELLNGTAKVSGRKVTYWTTR